MKDKVLDKLSRILWLNPPDSQGARFCLGDVERGRSYAERRGIGRCARGKN